MFCFFLLFVIYYYQLKHGEIANTFKTARHGHCSHMIRSIKKLFVDRSRLREFFFLGGWINSSFTLSTVLPSGIHRWFVEAHIIKTVQIYPEDPLFHRMKSAICLSCCHHAAYSQPTVNYLISLVCFPVRKKTTTFCPCKEDLLCALRCQERGLFKYSYIF